MGTNIPARCNVRNHRPNLLTIRRSIRQLREVFPLTAAPAFTNRGLSLPAAFRVLLPFIAIIFIISNQSGAVKAFFPPYAAFLPRFAAKVP